MLNKRINLSGRSGEHYLPAFLLGFGCLLLALFPIMLVERGFFIYAGDYNAQQITFYHTVNNAVRDGQFGWNWFTDLGSDLLASYSFYLFGSPFFWLSTLLPAGAVTYAMPVLLAIKHGFASMTAYAYIRRFVRSKRASLIGGLLYAFSGFQVFNIFFNHFQDVTAFFPLMLIAMEENINNRRRGVFALTVALMALLNYYFFAGQAVFLVIYYLFRMRCPDFHTNWKKFALLAFEAIVGTLIAAVILLPTALSILGNARLDEKLYGADFVLYTDRTLIPRIIESFFMPCDPPASPILFYSEYETWASIGGYFPLFSMVGVAAFMKGRKKHWATKLSLFLMLCAAVPLLNSMFQALNAYYYARWFYMPLLIFALMTAQSLDDEDADLMFGWKLTAAVTAAIAVIGILPIKGSEGELLFLMLPTDLAYFWITVAVAAAGLIASRILLKRRKNGKEYLKPAVLLTAVASIICIYTAVFYDAYTIGDANAYIDSVIYGKQYMTEDISSDNFFRTDISEDGDNHTMYWDQPSMRAFHSVVETSIMDFYTNIGITRNVASRADITHYTLRGLFSVKYFYRNLKDKQTYQEIISSESDNKSSPPSLGFDKSYMNADITEYLEGFEYISSNDYFETYENTLYIPMGFGYDSYISEAAAKKRTDEQRERLLLSSLVLSDEQIEKYSDILTEYTDTRTLDKDDYREFCLAKQQNCSSSFTFDSKSFRSEITLQKPELMFFSVPYSKGWTAEVNGKKADVERVSYGFMAVRAEEGDNTIVFRYKTPGLAAGAAISGGGILLLVLYLIIMHLVSGKDEYYSHTHYYDYSCASLPSAHKSYCSKAGKKIKD